MIYLNSLKYTIVTEDLPYDDTTLFESAEKLKTETMAKKEVYVDKQNQNNFEKNYLGFKMARLSYAFAKEEYNAIIQEVIKRGLITESMRK